jgi:hypothetical protein
VVRYVLFVALLAAGAVAGATPAAAQACEPGVYGCPTTTSTTTGTGTTIELDVDEGDPGTVVRARACGYAEGAAVSVTFEGAEVGSGVAGTDGCVTVTFTVPDVAPGVRQVCATSPGRPTACAEFTVTGVLSAGQAQAGESTRGGGARGGALARTGAAIGLLVVLGALLVAGGRVLRHASGDRGRREAAR